MARFININLKWGPFKKIELSNVTVVDSGNGDRGAGMDIQTRNDGTYADKPATLTGLEINGGAVTGGTTGIIIGGDIAAPAGVGSTVTGVNLAGNGVAVENNDGPTIDASHNYWGDNPNFGALVSGDVTYLPYWANSSMAPVVSEVTLAAPSAVVAGNEFTVTANVSPGTSQGDVELYNGTTLLTTKTLASGKASFTVQFGTAGSQKLHAVFKPVALGPVTDASTSAPVSVQVNEKKSTPAPPPASDSEQLAQDIADGKIAPIPPSEFAPAPGSGNSSPSNINPAEGLSGNIPWSDGTDSFVDAYAYSTPVFLGTFPVVNGEVQLNLTPAMLELLESGSHQLVFIGQTSGTTQAMAISIQSTGTSGGQDTGSGGLAATGSETAILPVATIASLMMLVGIGAAVTPSLRRRFARR